MSPFRLASGAIAVALALAVGVGCRAEPRAEPGASDAAAGAAEVGLGLAITVAAGRCIWRGGHPAGTDDRLLKGYSRWDTAFDTLVDAFKSLTNISTSRASSRPARP